METSEQKRYKFCWSFSMWLCSLGHECESEQPKEDSEKSIKHHAILLIITQTVFVRKQDAREPFSRGLSFRFHSSSASAEICLGLSSQPGSGPRISPQRHNYHTGLKMHLPTPPHPAVTIKGFPSPHFLVILLVFLFSFWRHLKPSRPSSLISYCVSYLDASDDMRQQNIKTDASLSAKVTLLDPDSALTLLKGRIIVIKSDTTKTTKLFCHSVIWFKYIPAKELCFDFLPSRLAALPPLLPVAPSRPSVVCRDKNCSKLCLVRKEEIGWLPCVAEERHLSLF